VVFSYHDYDRVSGFGDLTIYSEAYGRIPFASGATQSAAVSADGARVLATWESSSDATSTTLVVGGTDGSALIPVTPISRLSPCAPRVAFGTSAFIVTHCAPDDANVVISAVDPVTGALTDLLSSAENLFAIVPGAGQVALIDSSGHAYLASEAGGALTPIGADAEAVGASADGTAAFVRSRSGSITRVPLDGSDASLVAENAVSLLAISPDGRELLFRSALGPRRYGDLLLTTADHQSPPLTLSTSVDATIFGDAFTADGSRVLYVTQANDLFVGTLESQPVAGGPIGVHGANAWTTRAYAGSRIVFTDDFAPIAKRPGRAVLRTVDTAGSDAPSIIASYVGPDFVLAGARDRVAFTFNDGTARSGLYVAPLP
jgi:hypothetical protein